jgi:hypothetical protein
MIPKTVSWFEKAGLETCGDYITKKAKMYVAVSLQ